MRETLKEVGSYTEIYSRLAVYNKGCAIASDISFVETTSAGWTAYGQTLDGSSVGTTDIPNRRISFSSSDFGTIDDGEYKIIEYKILSDIDQFAGGILRYNLTWGDKNSYEAQDFEMNTTKYSEESHLSFGILAIGSYKDRSAEPNEYQIYNLTVTNVGDLSITNSTWNVTLSIPPACNVTNISDSGSYSSGEISWQLEALNISQDKIFNFTMNCSTNGKKVLIAKGMNDTRAQTTITNNSVGIGCTGSNCSSDSVFYNFTTTPGLRYEEHSEVDYYITYNWSAYGLTIGEGKVNMICDDGVERILWQNYSFSNASGSAWANYTFDEEELQYFSSHIREINVESYTDGIGNEDGNITIEKIVNVWDYGKSFNDSQSLFVNIKPYTFTPTAPVLSGPLNGSTQVGTLALSWGGQTAPSGVNITYYIYGDSVNGTTLLGSTTETSFLWGFGYGDSGVYYWNVKAVTSEGQNSSLSETWQFELDVCAPDTDYAYALDYPMSYNNVTDTITVWGSNGTDGYDVMGSNESDSITLLQIYEFGRAARRICAITHADGTSIYSMLSRLEIGNTSSLLNTTYVKTVGETVGFSQQLQLNFNSTLISGELTAGGIAQSGSTLAFSGLDATGNSEGQFYLLGGSELKLYDTGVSHSIDANNSNPFRLYWNGDVSAKSSVLQNWYTIRFLGDNNTLDGVNIINVGEGFYPATTQVGTLSSINPGNVDTGGLMLEGDSNVTISSLEVSDATDDILFLNYTGVTNLVNPTLNWSNLNWTTGSFAGQVNRKYNYDLTTVDSTGSALENTTIVMLDIKGNILFSLTSDSSGEVAQQLITRAIYDYDYKTGNDQGSHTLYIKKYGKSFISSVKEFAAATIETTQVVDNLFSSLSAVEVADLDNLEYNPPTKVAYGDEVNSSWELVGQLANYPIDQCQFFAVFANDTKLVEGSSNNYTMKYETGEITFIKNMSGYDIRPVYYYGGNLSVTNGITIANAFSMGDLYDYMQYASATTNLSEELTTVDGVTYSFCIDLAVGNSTDGGSIQDAGKTIEFEEGYDVVEGDGGAVIDLAGVGGSGTVGAIEITRREIYGGQWQTVTVSLSDNLGNALTGRTLSVEILYPNGTCWIDGETTMDEVGSGLYRYEFQIPGSHRPYGGYAVHITATGINEIRAFEYIPDSIINVRGYLDTDEYLDWSRGYIRKNDHQINLLGAVQNQYGYAINLSQYFLWDSNYFLMIDSKLKQNWDSLEIYEESNTNVVDEVINTDTSDWEFSGDVLNISATEDAYVGDYALNVLLNYSTGIGTVSRNFSSVDVSDSEGHLHLAKIYINFPDMTNISNISIKLETNETNYYILNKNLAGWKLWGAGWNSLHYPDVEERTKVGNPSSSNISGIEITFYHNYTTPTNITMDHLQVDEYDLVPSSRLGTKNIADSYYLFWWDENDKYNLAADEERNFWLKINSSQYSSLTQWHEQYPNDEYITEQYNGMMDANFYWEHWLAEENVYNYLQGNPGQNLFMMSDVGSSYGSSDSPRISILTSDRLGNLVSSDVSVNVSYPNGSILSSGIPSSTETGRYNYSFDIPSDASLGDYSVRIDANYSGYNATQIHTFSVSTSSSGGLPLNVFSGVGSTYAPGNVVHVISTTIDSTGELINATISVQMYYPNNSLMSSGLAAQSSDGRTRYNYTLPGSVPEGTYTIEIDANYSGDEVHESLAFIVDIAGSGSANPEVIVEAPDVVDTNTNISITVLTLSDSGVAANCDNGANITIRDILSGSVLVSNAVMTNYATGQYNYTWITENKSVYVAAVVCTISGIDYTGTTTFSTQDVSTEDEFRISSLVVGSPKYPDETAIVEATFEDSTGANVTPDTIDLTIWYPSYLSIWDSAVKSDFTIRNETVWWYAKSIESNPTTGDYRVHMQATYNNITATALTEFRVATGGPYSVTLNCPDSSVVGSNLECNLIIIDEGEAATESTCDIWVDSDGDIVMDATEPQSQYSQQTSPLDNLTRAVSINVPGTHSTGNYVTRASCSYANSAQPPSNASDSVIFTSAVVTPPPTDGGGGGGGGGAPTQEVEENVSEEEIVDEEIIVSENLKVRILPKYLEIYSGEDIAAEVIFNLEKDVKDAKIKYFVKNSEGKVVVSIQELIDVTRDMKILKEINLPEGLEYGEYLLVVKLEYENKGYIGEDSFDIILEGEKGVPTCCLGGICWFKFILCWYWWLLILIILMVIIAIGLIIKHRSYNSRLKSSLSLVKPRRTLGRRLREVGHKKDLKELVSYIIKEVDDEKNI
ncbi:hypothetical protein KAJ38_02510 [Candidatus Pacearchaeota archaeon]|nr:hypothetical protein [Candidatus Pacearchaeota archaeon]